MKPTCFDVIENANFHKVCPAAPEGVPRGNLLEVSVNPYNGQFVVTFQRSPEAIELIGQALGQINFDYGTFFNFADDAVKREPRYALRAVV
ncbi:hypothetical protein GS424_008530 [Eggerthella guodeyinii]|uniref:Uncharacterized protein n=1 Tax=Eggerthella guodeyinii TaxID=2690837 RepID=A0A6L7IRN1_9ACTN|nr:hypothetical protein [Eggerthella guodeyinii]QOS69865.1 hypothetical protein GS424_008530 [Eggerthella guodeyinii]